VPERFEAANVELNEPVVPTIPAFALTIPENVAVEPVNKPDAVSVVVLNPALAETTPLKEPVDALMLPVTMLVGVMFPKSSDIVPLVVIGEPATVIPLPPETDTEVTVPLVWFNKDCAAAVVAVENI
jgi:hypothetical protein